MFLLYLVLLCLYSAFGQDVDRNPGLCSPFPDLPLLPPCPVNETLIPTTVTVYFTAEGRGVLPDLVRNETIGYAENVNGELRCFQLDSYDEDCTLKALSGYPINIKSNACSKYKCTVESECHCKTVTPKIRVEVVAGTEILTSVRSAVYKVFIVPGKYITHRKLLQLPGRNFVEYSHDTVKIIFGNPVSHSVLFQKDSFSQLRTTTDHELIFAIPSEMYGVSGNLFITIYESDVIVETTSVYLVGRSYCRLDDCILCMDAVINARCLPNTHMIFLLIITSVFTCIILYVIIRILSYIFRPVSELMMFLVACCICCRRNTKIQRVFREKVKKVSNITKDWLSESKDEDMPLVKPQSSNGSATKLEEGSVSSPSPQQAPLLVTFIITLLFLPLIVSANHNLQNFPQLPGLAFGGNVLDECRDGITIPTTSTTCTIVNSTSQLCQVDFSLVATIPNAQTAACITLVDANKHHMVDLRVFYMSLEHIWTTANCYGSSSFNFYAQANRPCGNPLSPNVCPNGCGITDRTGHGTLTNPLVTQYSGKTDCYKSCGSAVCNCWLSVDSCMYYGWSVIGKAPFYEICEPIKQELRPIVVIFAVSGNTVIQYAALDGDTNTKMGNITFATVGNFLADPINLGDLRLVRNTGNNSYSLGLTSKLNQPVVGTLGEIQASTVAELTLSGQHIKFPDNLVSIKGELEEVFFRPVTPYADRYHFESTTVNLPGFRGGNQFDYGPKPGQFYTNATRAPGFQFSLKTSQPFTFYRSVTTVCPKAIYWTGGGYRKSPKGVTLLFNVSSTCLNGLVSVTTSGSVDLWTHSVLCTTTTTTVAIKLGTQDEANSITVNFVGNGGTVSIPVSFTAVSDTTVQLPDGTNTTIDAPATSGVGSLLDSLGKLLDDFIKGDLNWILWVIVGLAITGAVILALGITAGSIAFLVITFAPALSALFGPIITLARTIPMVSLPKEKSN